MVGHLGVHSTQLMIDHYRNGGGVLEFSIDRSGTGCFLHMRKIKHMYPMDGEP